MGFESTLGWKLLYGKELLEEFFIDAHRYTANVAIHVHSQAGLLSKWNGKPSKKGAGFEQPLAPHQHWHIDLCGTQTPARGPGRIRRIDSGLAPARGVPTEPPAEFPSTAFRQGVCCKRDANAHSNSCQESPCEQNTQIPA
jgi:hypothetical protein